MSRTRWSCQEEILGLSGDVFSITTSFRRQEDKGVQSKLTKENKQLFALMVLWQYWRLEREAIEVLPAFFPFHN